MNGLPELPQDIEAEQAVLGSLMIDTHAIKAISEIIEPDDFYLPAHSVVYAAALRLRDRGVPTDIVTLWHELKTTRTKKGDSELEAIGGDAYLAALPLHVPTSVHALHYAGLVRETAIKRAEVMIGARLVADGDAEDAMERLRRLKLPIGTMEWGSTGDAIQSHLERLLGPVTEDGQRITMGVGPLDTVLKGMRRNNLIVIGARPGEGKTSLATTISRHVAVALRKPVAFFTHEMTREEMIEKLFSIMTKEAWERLTSHNLTVNEAEKLTQAAAGLRGAPIEIIPATGWTIEAIRKAGRQITKQRGRLGLVVVDYIQIVETERRYDNQTQAVAFISKNLKEMAHELGCPVLVVSQLNRLSENRPRRMPVMADLKESGAIEQDAHIVILLHHPKDEQERDPHAVEIVTAIIGKNRFGPKDVHRALGFHGALMEFMDPPLSGYTEPSPPPLPSPKRGREAAYRDDDSEGMTL